MDRQFAVFLRRQRGRTPYQHFARHIGTSTSTAFRIEKGRQSVSLRLVEQILNRLHCRIDEVFRDNSAP
ncbi:MAG: helix-turn-helix domain-containing protein [Verrucomicrobiales bacterium]|nr:helix-turn-helix domain-containing protein [Verrucomicrobiales bacterium]